LYELIFVSRRFHALVFSVLKKETVNCYDYIASMADDCTISMEHWRNNTAPLYEHVLLQWLQ